MHLKDREQMRDNGFQSAGEFAGHCLYIKKPELESRQKREKDDREAFIQRAIQTPQLACKFLAELVALQDKPDLRYRRNNDLAVAWLRCISYREYLGTLHWAVVRYGCRHRAKEKCQVCNSGGQLETHHRSYERRGYEGEDDVTLLCDRCHGTFHSAVGEEWIELQRCDHPTNGKTEFHDAMSDHAVALILKAMQDRRKDFRTALGIEPHL